MAGIFPVLPSGPESGALTPPPMLRVGRRGASQRLVAFCFDDNSHPSLDEAAAGEIPNPTIVIGTDVPLGVKEAVESYAESNEIPFAEIDDELPTRTWRLVEAIRVMLYEGQSPIAIVDPFQYGAIEAEFKPGRDGTITAQTRGPKA